MNITTQRMIKKTLLLGALAMAFLLSPIGAFAAQQNVDLGLVGGIVDMFTTVLHGFDKSIQSSALKLAGVLMAVEVAYFWYQKWGSSEMDDLSSIFMLLLKHMVLIGFWFWAMNHAQDILQSIYYFFQSTGQAANPAVNINNLFSEGINLAEQLQKNSTLTSISFLTSPMVFLTLLVAMFCLVAAFAVVAAQVLLAKVEFLLVITAAPIYMAFGVFKFSRDWATKTISHAVATGTKILLIYMLAGMMMKLAVSWGVAMQTMNVFVNPNQFLEIIGASLMLIMLAFFVPSVAAALMSGNASLSGSSAIMGAMAVGATATAGAAAAVQGMGKLADGGRSAAGSIGNFLGGLGGGSAISEFGGGSTGGTGAGVPGIGNSSNSSGPDASSPDASQPAAPSSPDASQPAAPSSPDASQPAAPSSPDASQPAAPSSPEASQPAAPGSGNASTASIGAPSPPANTQEKTRLRDHLSGAANKAGDLINHGQGLIESAGLNDQSQVGGASIRVD